jgi:hypothetical protein
MLKVLKAYLEKTKGAPETYKCGIVTKGGNMIGGLTLKSVATDVTVFWQRTETIPKNEAIRELTIETTQIAGFMHP